MFNIPVSRSFRRVAATAALAFAATATPAGRTASAGVSTVDFASTSSLKGLGSFSGSATLDGDLLTVQVTNASARGRLYGLAFDIEEGKAVYEKNDGKHGFESVAGKHGLKVKPFGRYEDALTVASNKHSIAAGASRTLLFQVSGAPADATAFDLLDNPRGESVVALFRGFRHGARDKAGAAVVLRLAPPADVNGTSNAAPVLPVLPDVAGDGPPVPGALTNAGPVILPPVLNPSAPGTHAGGTIGKGGLPTGSGAPGGSVDSPDPGPTPAAVPLPPAAWTGLGTLVVMAGVNLKGKLIKSLA